MRLTDLTIKNLPLPARGQRDYYDDQIPGFVLRVSQGGARTFALILRRPATTRISLGRYGIVTLSQAREEARRILAERTLGKLRPQSITYPEAVKLFIEEKKKVRRATTAEQYEWFLGRFAFKCQLTEVRHADIERQANRITSPSTRDHCLVAIRVLFNWAVKRRYVTENPTVGLTPSPSRKRSRTLTADELKAIWEACSDLDSELPTPYRTIVKLLMITGQRRSEIAGLRASFIDGTVVTLPDTLTKNHRVHVFPLPDLAVQLLRSVEIDASREDAVFFPARGKPEKPFNGWSKAKIALNQISGVTGWKLHDLRRTFRTTLARLGVAPHIAERLVNHVASRSEMEEVYDHYRYLPELRDAMMRHEECITGIIGKLETPAFPTA